MGESGVEELRREVKSMADEERCIRAKTRVSLGCDSASLIVGELQSAGTGGRNESEEGLAIDDGFHVRGKRLRVTGDCDIEPRWLIAASGKERSNGEKEVMQQIPRKRCVE